MGIFGNPYKRELCKTQNLIIFIRQYYGFHIATCTYT